MNTRNSISTHHFPPVSHSVAAVTIKQAAKVTKYVETAMEQSIP